MEWPINDVVRCLSSATLLRTDLLVHGKMHFSPFQNDLQEIPKYYFKLTRKK